MNLVRGSAFGNIIGGGKSYVPTDDGADLAFYYDAEAYTGGASVQQLDDLSPSNIPQVQATGTRRPAYNATIFSGRPGITFSVDDVMTSNAVLTLNTHKAIFIIGSFTAGNGGILIEHGPNAFGNAGFFLMNPAINTNGSWMVNDLGGSGNTHYSASNTGGTASGARALSFEYSGSGGVVKTSGVPLSPAPSTIGTLRSNAPVTAFLSIGARANGTFPSNFILNAMYGLNRVATSEDIANFLAFAAGRGL